jgi:hypothetical protein
MTEDERKSLKTIEAFKMVFGGSEKTRTEFQRVVWRELAIMGYEERPVFVADKAGALCPLRAAMTDGRRSLWADIKANVNFSAPRAPGQK